MYIPKHFSNTDKDSIMEFIRKYSFGLIVSAQDNIPEATHLPFLIEERDGEVIITSHLAKANPQSGLLTDNEVMVVFSEPHAYVSPQHYEKEQSVPTWNYIAVHVYGRATIIDAEDELNTLMEKMIAQYDTAYLSQWNNLPAEYKNKMFKGIVAFEIKASSLQAKNKLSQNRSDTERENIIKAFEGSTDSNEATIAEYMKKTK
jgi:transcriptional regulator